MFKTQKSLFFCEGEKYEGFGIKLVTKMWLLIGRDVRGRRYVKEMV